MKPFALLCLLFTLAGWSYAEGYSQLLTVPVSQEDGDTIGTYQVSVSSCFAVGNCGTRLSAAVTNRRGRRRGIRNLGTNQVFIGSHTATLVTSGFLLDTSTMTIPVFWTHSSAELWGMTAASTGTVNIIEETTATP